MIKELHILLEEAKQQLAKFSTRNEIEEYATLVQLASRKELEDEIRKLDTMLILSEETMIKAHFQALCIARDEQNLGTRLHFTISPDSACNMLYFNMAKRLHPEAPFSVLSLLLPSIKKIGMGTLQVEYSQTQEKRRRLNPTANFSEIDIIKATSHDELTYLKITPEFFKRLVYYKDAVFLLDTISSFDFDLHCEFYKVLTDKAPLLCEEITSHNGSLAEFYKVIAHFTGTGASLYSYISPLINVMSVSGERFGSGAHATNEGIKAAAQIAIYYHSLPQELKEKIGDCKKFEGDFCFRHAIDLIANQECIETTASYLRAILDNPVNYQLMQSTPHLTEEEKHALRAPYDTLSAGKHRTHLFTLNKDLHISCLPTALAAHFYKKITIINIDQLVGLLIIFPTTEYLEILQHTNLSKLSFIESMFSVVMALDSHQQEALIAAIKDEDVRKNMRLPSSRLLAACINTDNPLFVENLLETYTEDQYLELMKEQDSDGKTVLHHVLENGMNMLADNEEEEEEDNHYSIHSLEILISLYPVNHQLLSEVLQIVDENHKFPLWYVIPNAVLLKRLLELYRVCYQDESWLQFTNDLLRLTKDGASALHDAAHHSKSLLFLLENYPNGDDCVAALIKRNANEQTILHPEIEDFFALTEDVLHLLIDKNVTQDTFVDFLNTPLTNNQDSLLTILTGNPDGITILNTLIKKDTGIMAHIPIETWIPARSLAGQDQSIPPICLLIKTPLGLNFLRNLALIKPQINNYMTRENFQCWGGDFSMWAQSLPKRATPVNGLQLFSIKNQEEESFSGPSRRP